MEVLTGSAGDRHSRTAGRALVMVDAGLFEYGIVAFSSIVAIMNPVSTLAVFATLTTDMNREERRKIARESTTIALLVLLFFAVSGQVIFVIFGLTLPAFKIAGGILLINFAIGMLHPRKVAYLPEELDNIAVVPLAFPLTCGAGTITTVILLASEAADLNQTAMVFVAILVAIGISFVLLSYAHYIYSFIGDHEIRIAMRLLSIIVLAIAVQFLITGTSEAMPQILAGVT